MANKIITTEKIVLIFNDGTFILFCVTARFLKLSHIQPICYELERYLNSLKPKKNLFFLVWAEIKAFRKAQR